MLRWLLLLVVVCSRVWCVGSCLVYGIWSQTVWTVVPMSWVRAGPSPSAVCSCSRVALPVLMAVWYAV